MVSLGQTVYLWRKSRRLTQAELARRSRISRPNLTRIEQGRDLTLETLRRLAQALQVRPGILADGIPPRGFSKKTFSRESLDRIARGVLGKRAGLSPAESEFASLIQSFVKCKTGFHLKGRTSREEQKSWLEAKVRFGSAAVHNVLGRLDKLMQISP